MNGAHRAIQLIAGLLLFFYLGAWAITRELRRYEILWVTCGEGRHISFWTELRITEAVLTASERHRLDPMLLLAIIKTESHFRPRVSSHRGALGLMQVKPIALMEVRADVDPGDGMKLRDNIAFNIEIGSAYLAWLLNNYNHDLPGALLAYNLGPTGLARRAGPGNPAESHYVKKVMKNYRGFTRKKGAS